MSALQCVPIDDKRWRPVAGGGAPLFMKRVRVRGLKKKPELNGLFGTAVEYFAATCRYGVSVEGGGAGKVSIAAANLELVGCLTKAQLGRAVMLGRVQKAGPPAQLAVPKHEPRKASVASDGSLLGAVRAMRIEEPSLGIKALSKRLVVAGHEAGAKEVRQAIAELRRLDEQPLPLVRAAAEDISDLNDDELCVVLSYLPRTEHAALTCVSQRWRALTRNEAFIAARRERPEMFVMAIAGSYDLWGSKRSNTMDSHARVSVLVDGKEWMQADSLPEPTDMHCAVACDEEVYVFGGTHGQSRQFMMTNPPPCACVMVYSPRRNEWRPTIGLSTKRCLPGAVACRGKVYAIGGMDTTFKKGAWAGDAKDMSHCEVYDPADPDWCAIPPMPYACNSGRCVAVGHKIYVMGGMIDVADDGHHFGAVQIYDTKRRRWSVLDQEMPIQGGQCFFDGERILVLGGVTSEERPPPRNIPVKVNFKAEVRKAHKRASSLSFLGEKSEVLLPTAGTPALEDLSSEEEDEEDRGKEEEGEEEDSEGEPDDRPATWKLVWPYNSPETNETWALHVATGRWEELRPAPKKHLGWYLYLDEGRETTGRYPSFACAQCGAESGKGARRLQKCSVCKAAHYCSTECQKLHRKLHKPHCTPMWATHPGVIRAADDPRLNYRIATDTWEKDPERESMTDHRNAAEIVAMQLPF